MGSFIVRSNHDHLLEIPDPDEYILDCTKCAPTDSFDLCESCFGSGHRCLDESHPLYWDQKPDGIANCARAKHPEFPITCSACAGLCKGLYLRE